MADRATCLRWTGRRRCAGGVDTESVRDAELRLPCHVIDGCTGATPCEHLLLPEVTAPELGPLSAALERALEGRCPTCSEPIAQELDVGGQVVATPCHHQLRVAR